MQQTAPHDIISALDAQLFLDLQLNHFSFIIRMIIVIGFIRW